jgi:hypothetical protein
LGVLKFLFHDCICWGFHFAGVFIQIAIQGFHSSCYSGVFIFRNPSRASIFFMLISKLFLAVEIAQLKKCIFRRLPSKQVSNIIFFMFISTVLLVTVEID